jgi:hypothetical protein
VGRKSSDYATHLEKGTIVKSLAASLFAVLFALSAGAAFAADPANDISSPWWDSEHVQLNPSADDDKPAPQPAPDADKEKS